MAHKNVKQAWREMMEGNALTVRARIVERMNKGEVPPSVTLPESKAEFPKLLFLDTNIWVALSQTHHGVKQRLGVSAATTAIREAVKARRLVLPITATNLDEATKHADAEERKRRARFMVDLSGNFSCLSPVVVRDHEIDRAVEKHILRDEKLPSIRPYLVHWGLAGVRGHRIRIFDADRKNAPFVEQLGNEPDMSAMLLAFGLDSDFHAEAGATEADLLDTVNKARSTDGHVPVLERMSDAFFYVLTRPNNYTRRIMFALMKRGVSEQVYADLIADRARLDDFAEDLHERYIWATLWFERDRSANDKPALNDARDGSFLGQAIAYGNIVLTEKRWAHLANKTKIAQRYGTTVLSRVDDLPDLLTQEGCI
jgi:hypothetical protein